MTIQEISAGLTSLCFLFFLSLFINGQATILPTTCSPSSCGNLRNISYPFRLKSSPSGCGDPDYELDCQDNKTVLLINSANYYVKEISYDTQLIRVVDIELAGNGNCTVPQRSLSSDEFDRDHRFDFSIFTEWASFVNCSGPIEDPTYTTVPCRSGNGVNVYVIYGSYVLKELKESCGLISTVPGRLGNVSNRTFDVIERILEKGFALDWSVGCRDCRSSGGSCDPFMFDFNGCNRGSRYWVLRTIKNVALEFFSTSHALLIVLLLVSRGIVAPICIFACLYYFRRSIFSTDNLNGNPQISPSGRPSTSKDVEMAEGESDGLQVPPKPILSSID